MRLDKFLNATNITKRRAIAQDMCESNVVLVNNIISKSSKEVKIGDIITLKFLESSKKYQVLKIPTLKNVPKNMKDEYIKEL
ncbi:RNA-binding S4 domain-containing protein [Helicobacter saguini]|uniref:RNA-binding S4 domain-containing protein n=1 Tax=Helicobacter saguini TaxID=1548018 RepID=A0A347VSF5_9HELI|nr:RNA-binding S4 domain-containing protein [Helicobacter saguini]MWV62529.1 RNA-binding S4 domain-containing protein [Helicobacter saguini]MWV66797.1 RNA-binding S4 domain-containing protein [Helicobacter saguini]MWV71297.1 RNA-binding S4 domain-containing protein [Helicobacter saguini]TLD94191.1 RNA-binding S4 domain-containing protein [Helicobacter saguini]